MSIYRRVLRYHRPFWAQTTLGLLLSLCGIGLYLLKPWSFKIILDRILPTFSSGQAVYYDFEKRFLRNPSFEIFILCLALVVIQLLWSLINWATVSLFVKTGLQALLKL